MRSGTELTVSAPTSPSSFSPPTPDAPAALQQADTYARSAALACPPQSCQRQPRNAPPTPRAWQCNFPAKDASGTATLSASEQSGQTEPRRRSILRTAPSSLADAAG